MRIKVTRADAAYTVDLAQFCRDHGVRPNDCEVIAATLRAGATYTMGAIDAPLLTVEKVGAQEPNETERLMTGAGFSPISVGGNCVAWGRAAADGSAQTIQVAHESMTLYADADSTDWLLGRFDDDGPVVTVADAMNLADAIALAPFVPPCGGDDLEINRSALERLRIGAGAVA